MRKTKKINKDSLQNIKSHYESERAKIAQAIKKAVADSELDMAGDEVDKIQGNSLHQMSEKILSRHASTIALIDNSLRIMAEEGMAINECECCGEPIGEKRLMVILGVRICVSCAEEAENNSKMFA